LRTGLELVCLRTWSEKSGKQLFVAGLKENDAPARRLANCFVSLSVHKILIAAGQQVKEVCILSTGVPFFNELVRGEPLNSGL